MVIDVLFVGLLGLVINLYRYFVLQGSAEEKFERAFSSTWFLLTKCCKGVR